MAPHQHPITPLLTIPLRRGINPFLLSLLLLFIHSGFPVFHTAAFASGSYRHSALPSSSKQGFDEGLNVEKFELGRRLFAGMIRLPEPNPESEATQAKHLQSLSNQLPQSQLKSAERLARMAGRLNNEQIDALDYFVKERFTSKSSRDKATT